MTQTDNNRLPYAAPRCEVLVMETQQAMLSSSITGSAPDSDDSEFGGASVRRGVWGDRWE